MVGGHLLGSLEEVTRQEDALLLGLMAHALSIPMMAAVQLMEVAIARLPGLLVPKPLHMASSSKTALLVGRRRQGMAALVILGAVLRPLHTSPRRPTPMIVAGIITSMRQRREHICQPQHQPP